MATLTFALSWLRAAVGRFYNPDNAYGYQCKDLVDAYCIALFGNWQNTVRPGNGKDVFDNANPSFFTKVRNNPADPAQLPPPGSILSFAGTGAVPEGHTAITESADRSAVNVVQMDGYKQVAAHRARLPYTGLIGWLIPKLDPEPKKAPAKPAPLPTRKVTQKVAWVRTKPHSAAPLAPGYPKGITAGGVIAVKGYVSGQDPYGTRDNAWYVTKSGFYVWANAAGNSLAGLKKIG